MVKTRVAFVFRWAVTVVATGMTLGVSAGVGAELRLKPQYQSDGTVVTLGDVAEILAAEPQQAEQMAAVELFAPPVAGHRYVGVREIQDRLLAHKVNLAEHRFTGCSQVAVLAARPASASERPLSLSDERRGKDRITNAVAAYLGENVSATQPWTVEVELTEDQIRLTSNPSMPLTVQPVSALRGEDLCTELQRFQVIVETPQGPASFPIDARIGAQPLVVVAAHSLSRGAMVRPTDLELVYVESTEAVGKTFRAIEEVVGKETTQAIAKGKPLQPEMVRSPLLVRRGEYVTVYARMSGIRVRTTARARDEGSLGELITVESMLDRQAYFARVSGAQEVEVYAQSIQADRAATPGP